MIQRNIFVIERLTMKKFKKVLQIFFVIFGSIAFLMSVIAFTPIPYNIRQWLATSVSSYKFEPQYIIMLGGSGMPSEDNLIRLYYTSEIAAEFPCSKIIIAHPYDSLVQCLMKNELEIRGIDISRVLFEECGTNTRSQVINIKDTFSQTINSNCLIVSSPEQMYRSVKAFRKSGFKKVGGQPAMPCDMFIDLSYNSRKLKGLKYVPDVGENLSLRYNFWNYLKLEITCMREFTAILYYKINGWI